MIKAIAAYTPTLGAPDYEIFLPHPSQAKSQNHKSQNPNYNPDLGGFIVTLNRYRYRRRLYRCRVLFEFLDFHYPYLNQF